MRAANSVALDHHAVGIGARAVGQADAAVHLFSLNADVEVGVARGDFGGAVEYDKIAGDLTHVIGAAIGDQFELRHAGITVNINRLGHD